MTKTFATRDNAVAQSNAQEGKLGTFGGVYTPSILTILGVIMYLRFGWVVGNVGLLGTMLIVTLSTSITFLTGLSISAIATDRVVKGGGAYYMISRSLGIEVGGAVGIPLFIAQTLSIALYIIGFAESVVQTFPILDGKILALVTTVLVAAVALKSASFAIRAQFFIMAAIALSLISFIFGHPITETTLGMNNALPPETEDFWTVFAVFFPAVTGIMAGVGMSGDLRSPTRSIPVGTLAAVGTGYLIYMILPILLAYRADAATLIADKLVMQSMSFWGGAILLGVWGATLSSALGSILGAPRVLQALARDKVLPPWLRFLGKGNGTEDEPRLGTFATLIIALVAVFFGQLNLIAPILSMFFLTTYLVLNLAAGLESFLQSPSFRPTFPVHWSLSFLGASGCLVVMFLIDGVATVLAAIIVFGIFIWLKERELETAWGDVRRGVLMTMIRFGLLRINVKSDSKNWRPHLLVFSGIPSRRLPLVKLSAALTHNHGLLTFASVLPFGSRHASGHAGIEERIRNYLEQQGIRGLARVITAEDRYTGLEMLASAYGLGAVIPDTILLGFSEAEENRVRYCQMICHLYQTQRHLVMLRYNPELNFGSYRRIDIWWSGGLQANGGLMLILAYLLRTSHVWHRAEIYLKLIIPDEAGAQLAQTNLENLMEKLRIKAIPEVILSHGESFDTIIHRSSAHSDLVFMGIPQPDKVNDFAHYYQKLQQRTSGLPTTVFVLAAPDFSFTEIFSG